MILTCLCFLSWRTFVYRFLEEKLCLWILFCSNPCKYLAASCTSINRKDQSLSVFKLGLFEKVQSRQKSRFVVRASSVRIICFLSCFHFSWILNQKSWIILYYGFWYVAAASLIFIFIWVLQDFYSVLGVSKNSSKSEIKTGEFFHAVTSNFQVNRIIVHFLNVVIFFLIMQLTENLPGLITQMWTSEYILQSFKSAKV